jgi:hypothetical protein
LQDPDRPFTLALLREFAVGDVSLDNPDYRSALERDVIALSTRIGKKAQVVLLGSVASGKYVDCVVADSSAIACAYPISFVGRGDMSRGGLLLRSAASGEELEYGPAHGRRPAARAAPAEARSVDSGSGKLEA